MGELVYERLAIIPISQPFLDVAVLQSLVIEGEEKLGVKNIFSLHKHKCSLLHCRLVGAGKPSAWWGNVEA